MRRLVTDDHERPLRLGLRGQGADQPPPARPPLAGHKDGPLTPLPHGPQVLTEHVQLVSPAQQGAVRSHELVGQRRARPQRGILGKDARLQGAQLLPGIHAQLLCQHLAGTVDRGQGCGLVVGCSLGAHQQGPRRLPERMGRDVRLQLADDHPGVPGCGPGSPHPLACRHPQVIEPTGLGATERGVLEPGVGRPSPEAEGLGECVGRRRGMPPGERRAAQLDQAAEPVGVHRHGVQRQAIATPGGHDHALRRRTVVSQGGPKPGDVDLQGLDRGAGWLERPQRVDEVVRRHDLVDMGGQRREQRALLGPRQAHLPSAIGHPQRPQDPHFHPRTIGPRVVAVQNFGPMFLLM